MRSHDDFWAAKNMPEWKRRRALGNPPAKYRQAWRREYRCVLNRLVRLAGEEFQPFPQCKVTDILDWY